MLFVNQCLSVDINPTFQGYSTGNTWTITGLKSDQNQIGTEFYNYSERYMQIWSNNYHLEPFTNFK